MGKGEFWVFLASVWLLPLAPAAAADSFVFKDPQAQTPDWTQPLNAPFVDLFQLLPGGHLLVGALGWDSGSLQFRQGDLGLRSTSDGSTLWSVKRKSIPEATYSVVAVQGGILVLQATSAKQTTLFAYALSNGRSLWDYSLKGAGSVELVDRLDDAGDCNDGSRSRRWYRQRRGVMDANDRVASDQHDAWRRDDVG